LSISDAAHHVEIRRIRADEGRRLRALRLRALADAPTAFGSTVVETRARPPAAWQQRAAESAAGAGSVLFVAERADAWLGLAGGLFEVGPSDEAELVSMWLEPAARGQSCSVDLRCRSSAAAHRVLVASVSMRSASTSRARSSS
jgi:hypothetical protein